MDRRTALKQLAAGGAIAAGGSLVVSSNAVAQTTSACATAPANPFSVSRVGNQIRIVDNSATSLPGSTAMFGWRINTYSNMGNNARLLIRRTSGNGQILLGPTNNTCGSGCPFPSNGYSANNSLNGAVTLSRANRRGRVLNLRNLQSSTYSVDVQVTWTFTNGCPTLTGEYRISGAGRNVPGVSKL